MSKQEYPCWLTQQQLAEADALLSLGFDYWGNADDFDLEDNACKIKKSGDWIFYSAFGEIILIAVYTFPLESDSEEIDGVDWFEEKLKIAVNTIKKIAAQAINDKHQQLTIFDFIS